MNKNVCIVFRSQIDFPGFNGNKQVSMILMLTEQDKAANAEIQGKLWRTQLLVIQYALPTALK